MDRPRIKKLSPYAALMACVSMDMNRMFSPDYDEAAWVKENLLEPSQEPVDAQIPNR